MSTPNRYTPKTNVQPPRCPKCAGELETIERFQWTAQVSMGLVIILAVYCPHANCRTLFNTQITIVPNAEEHSGLVQPS